MRILGILMALVICNQAVAKSDREIILKDFYEIESAVYLIKINLNSMAELDQNNFSAACFLSGSISGAAYLGQNIAGSVGDNNPTEKSDKNGDAHDARSTYFSKVFSFMNNTEQRAKELAFDCKYGKDANHTRFLLKALQTALKEDLASVDSERKRAIEASNLKDIIRE